MHKFYYLLAVSLFFLLSSCEKDQEVAPAKSPELTEADYQTYQKQTTPQFTGTINGKFFSWRSGAFSLSTGRCDYEPYRELYFAMTEGRGTRFFRLYFPHYLYRDEADFNKVFALGKKELGDMGNYFHLEMTVNNQNYDSRGSLKINELEILKTEEFLLEGTQTQDGLDVPYQEKCLRLWIKVNAQLSTYSNHPDKESVTVKGIIISNLYDF